MKKKETTASMAQNTSEINDTTRLDEKKVSNKKMNAEDAPKKDSGEYTLLSWVRDIAIMIPIVVLVVVLIKLFLFGTYEIPSGSMIDTIEIGDRVISEKISYLSRDPEVGEIITFADPNVPGRTLIKRVIATEGQTVDLQDGKVIIDGTALDEQYTDGKPSYPLSMTSTTVTYPFTVPEDCLWVMGDNRTESADSRYFGAIPVDSVSGHAVFTYWPIDRAGNLE